ncbi:MAG: hypothetical protein Q7R64_01150 [bacterium]|nr:hypothetical protein [bacterium]
MARHKVLRSPRLVRKEQKKKVRKTLVVTCLCSLVLALVLYGFSRPQFIISRIEVSGASRVSEASVVELVKRGMEGSYLGFIPKAHSLLFPKADLSYSLTREFPTLSGVSLSLSNLASLHVAVHEREPRAKWCSGAFGCFLIDETGFAFMESLGEEEGQYYRLEKSATSSPLAREVIDTGALSGIISFLTQLEKMEFDPEKAVLVNEQELEVVLSGGARLLLRNTDYARSLVRLQTLLREDGVLPGRSDLSSVSYIDLRYGNKIYFQPR